MAENQSFLAKRQQIHDVLRATADERQEVGDEVLQQHLRELNEQYMPDAYSNELRGEINQLIGYLSFELMMRQGPVEDMAPELEYASSDA